MMRRTIAMLAMIMLVSGCDQRRYYELSPLTGVAEVDVVTHMDTVAGRIVKREQVAAITAFMNARLDHWYDPHGDIFATTGDLDLLDARGKRLASIAFGPGGMYQTRPSMTYTDAAKRRQFIVIRAPRADVGAKDAAILCGLIGAKFNRTACVFH
jgi:hypothetical protein